MAALLIVPSTALGAEEFPAGFSGYHTYAEVAAAAKAVETAHPDIAKRFSIGKSYQGREIWAMKISDNVGTDEAEPEVLYEGGHHADEHMGVELALKVMRWLTDGYGTTTRITNIVNTREIWIIFLANPDGAEHDISGGKFHHWRKNRQPTPGTPYTGTDLNRNYGYRWGGGGRTSTNPQAITYRGTKAFSTPEARAIRDFLASRVIGGRQQIRTAVSFHESGRLVMWPYGYTYTDIPSDMTKADHDALVAIGKKMAASNGYRPIQASSLYITSGTTRDFMYGMYRTYSYTFELSVTEYPDDSKISSETGRNKEAVLYLAERASCPLSVLGEKVRLARCGAFDDDLEVFRGWTYDPDGTDTATTGKFSRANPLRDVIERPEAADRRSVGIAGVRDGWRRRVLGERERPRRADLGPESGDQAVNGPGPAAVLPVRARPWRELDVRRSTGGQHRNVGRHPHPGHHADRQAGRRRWRVALRRCFRRRVGRPDGPHPLRGGRWREQQPGRGRDRRRPDHAGVVGSYSAGPVPGRSPGLRSLRRMRRRSLRRTPPGATRRPRPDRLSTPAAIRVAGLTAGGRLLGGP